MEPHKLRFVRCPKCYQLLVEYPSIPVYKCGGCSTVLRAKNRALPTVQARSESDAENSVPSSLKGSPQDSKSICSEENKTASPVDQPPREALADGIISSLVNNANSCEDAIEERPVSVAMNADPAQYQEETCSFIDKNIQNPGVTIKAMHEKSTEADVGTVENLDTSENANGGKVDTVDMSVMRTLDKKTEVVQREERLHTHEDMLVESHEALIEELERSLSFSSDDEYFSDEAETSGLSDALRHQMGSRRFMFGGQMNDSSRNDPHGRLIEELEMSFSDVEEPMEQHAVGVDKVNGNKHNKHPETLAAGSANPCEESIYSLDEGLLESKKTSHQGNKPFDNGNEGKEGIDDDNNSDNDVHEAEHDKHLQILGPNSAHPCEESIPPLENGHLESEQTFLEENRLLNNENQWMEDIESDNCTANDAHGNEHIVVLNEILEERFHEKKHSKDLQPVNAEVVNPCERSVSSIDGSDMKFNQTIQPSGLTADGTQENREGCMDDGNMTNFIHGYKNVLLTNEDVIEKVHGNEEVAFDCTKENGKNHVEDFNPANYVHGEEHVAVADEHIAEKVDKNEQDKDQQSPEAEFAVKVHCNEEVAFDHTGENDENHVEDDNPANNVHGEENIAVADEHIAEKVDKNEQDMDQHSQEAQFAEKVHGNEEVAFDRTGENDENHVEDDNPANYVHGEENVVVADEHIAEKVDKNERDKDQQSQEAEFSNTRHVKSEVMFKQEDLISDSSKQKEEYDDMGDGNPTNSIQEDSTAVASFSSRSNNRTQCKLSSFNKNKAEAPYKYRASQLRQGLSLDAKDFKSIQGFIESQMDGTSSSLSSGSPCQGDLVHGRSNKFNNIVRHERLKKMDELRDQLSRLSNQKGMGEKYQRRGLEYQQQSDSYDVEQHLENADVDSVPSSCTLESYYGYERPPRYQPPNHFSPTHTYPHCDFGHAQARIPYNHDVWEFNTYYQSSYTESTILEHDSMLSYKEMKRVVRKHILRPLSGASPFSICSSCFNLIQMPSDMYISKAKVGKMQCGRCSKVLVLSFAAAYHAEGKISVDVLEQSNKPAGSTVAKNKVDTSHSSKCLRGPVSINEEYGASFRRSFSTQVGASLAATQSGKKVSDTALHRLMGYDSASQLLRHSRALDDGYDSFESMVPVSRRVSRRKNM